MAKVCVLLAQGFEEIEAIAVIDVLRRAEIEVTSLGVRGAGAEGREVTGSHGITVRADRTLASGAQEEWDMVVLPGGIPGSHHLRDDVEVQALIQRQHRARRGLAAICAAPLALSAAGVLQGRRTTSYPGLEPQLAGATYVQDRVACDGHVVTSRGPGTSLEFALELVGRLRSPEAAQKLRQGMLVQT